MRATARSPLLFITDHRFDRADELSSQLLASNQRLRRELGLPMLWVPVRIYIFESSSIYHAYLRKHFPSFGSRVGPRRSIFLLRDGVPHIFAIRGKELLRDLRHEYCHVILNTQIHGLPMWVDEGIAEYFENADHSLDQPSHVALLRRQRQSGWTSTLNRLEQLGNFREMGDLEYAEAWSWIDFLLRGPEETSGVLRNYLSDLRFGTKVPSIRERLVEKLGDPERRWGEHMRRMLGKK